VELRRRKRFLPGKRETYSFVWKKTRSNRNFFFGSHKLLFSKTSGASFWRYILALYV
jgi:hypothetical protein